MSCRASGLLLQLWTLVSLFDSICGTVCENLNWVCDPCQSVPEAVSSCVAETVQPLSQSSRTDFLNTLQFTKKFLVWWVGHKQPQAERKNSTQEPPTTKNTRHTDTSTTSWCGEDRSVD